MCVTIFNKTSVHLEKRPMHARVTPSFHRRPFTCAIFQRVAKKERNVYENPGNFSEWRETKSNTCERACITRNIIKHITGVTHRVNEKGREN